MERLIILAIILVFAGAAAAPVIAKKCPAIRIGQARNWYGLDNEIPTIYLAAKQNRCTERLFNILLAIRKAENGPEGFEFGVIAVKDTNLERQARWAAVTVSKNFERFKLKYGIKNTDKWDIPCWEQFIDFLGDKYCPFDDDPTGNVAWRSNVKFWFKKFEG